MLLLSLFSPSPERLANLVYIKNTAHKDMPIAIPSINVIVCVMRGDDRARGWLATLVIVRFDGDIFLCIFGPLHQWPMAHSIGTLCLQSYWK